MDMYFESSCEATILFQWWRTTNCTEYLFSCIFIAVVCVARHYLHDFRMSVLAKKATSMPSQEMAYLNPNNSTKFDTFSEQGQSHETETPLSALAHTRLRLPLVSRLLWTLSFAIKMTASFFLMLVVMTFNSGLFISVILGESIGYFVWGTHILHNLMADGSHH